MGELRNKCVANLPDFWVNVTVRKLEINLRLNNNITNNKLIYHK